MWCLNFVLKYFLKIQCNNHVKSKNLMKFIEKGTLSFDDQGENHGLA